MVLSSEQATKNSTSVLSGIAWLVLEEGPGSDSSGTSSVTSGAVTGGDSSLAISSSSLYPSWWTCFDFLICSVIETTDAQYCPAICTVALNSTAFWYVTGRFVSFFSATDSMCLHGNRCWIKSGQVHQRVSDVIVIWKTKCDQSCNYPTNYHIGNIGGSSLEDFRYSS